MTSNGSKKSDDRYNNYHDILSRHGLFVAFGYWLSRLSRYCTPTRLLFRLPKMKCFQQHTRIWNKKYKKATPIWHDIGVLILAVLTAFILIMAFSENICLSVAAWWIAWYLLIDMIIFHASVLWFDDLGIKQTTEHKKVWSHRRILFQAFLNFLESIALFAAIYHPFQAEFPFLKLAQSSFDVATTLTRPDSLSDHAILVDLQVGTSIFFLVVVVSVLASISYNRHEIERELQ